MATVYDQAFEIVVGHEGGYVNNPADPGGETKYGISKRSYPSIDIINLTIAEAKTIYYNDYWLKAGCDLWEPILAVIMFDAAVNNGVGQAVRFLQAAAGVPADGIIGEQTKAAVAKLEHAQLATDAHANRIMFMAALQTWGTFGKGWSRRLAALPAQAAQGSAGGAGG